MEWASHTRFRCRTKGCTISTPSSHTPSGSTRAENSPKDRMRSFGFCVDGRTNTCIFSAVVCTTVCLSGTAPPALLGTFSLPFPVGSRRRKNLKTHPTNQASALLLLYFIRSTYSSLPLFDTQTHHGDHSVGNTHGAAVSASPMPDFFQFAAPPSSRLAQFVSGT